MDLDDALLGFDKMPSSWTKEEKQRKDRKTLSHIHLHLSNQILQRRSEGKNYCCIMDEVREVMHDEKHTK